MAFLKQSVVYTVCALAFVLYQFEVTSAFDCLSCSSTNDNTTSSYCDSSNITDTTKYQNCTSTSTCYEVLYQVNSTNYVERGCNLNCNSSELLANQTSAAFWSCMSCNGDFCNTEAISDSSASISRITFGSLLLSAAVTLYLY